MNKFLKLVAIILLPLLSFINGLAQNNNGLLFEITGNGIKSPSYIMGTVTLANKNKFLIDESILKYIDKCDLVATEFDMLNGIPDLVDSIGLDEYTSQVFTRLNYLQTNGVYLPTFGPGDNASQMLFALFKTGGSSLKQMEGQYLSRLGLSSDAYKTIWPNYHVMQYAIKSKKPYIGLQSIDSILYCYLNYLSDNKNLLETLTDEFKNIKPNQEQDISKLIGEWIASGKAEVLFKQLKTLKNGTDTIILKILNLRNAQICELLDSQMKKQSVFAAVNYLSLTNPEGILRKLRKMGYKVKAIKMKSDAENTFSKIKEMPYETKFNTVSSDDGILKFQFPGRAQSVNIGPYASTWIHYDVINNSFYAVGRFTHLNTFNGHTRAYLLSKIDSLIYEEIPGTIIKKEKIEGNYFTGYDITSVNRNDDYTRSRFYITDNEIIILKCDGEKKYAISQNVSIYFAGFNLNEDLLKEKNSDTPIETEYFTALAPGIVHALSENGVYYSYHESFNSAKNIDIIYAKSSYQSFDFLDEDTFILNSIILSATKSLKLIEMRKKLETNRVTFDYKDELGRYYTFIAIKSGIHFYLISASYPDSNKLSIAPYLESFKPINNNKYPDFKLINDTTIHAEVQTFSAANEIVSSRLMQLIFKIATVKRGRYGEQNASATHSFSCRSTGEFIGVTYTPYDPYYYIKDSITFWDNLITNKSGGYEFNVSRKKHEYKNGIHQLSFLFTDTNTSFAAKYLFVLKGRALYIITTTLDTTLAETPFVSTFYNTFKPTDTSNSSSIFVSRCDEYLKAMLSTDSVTFSEAILTNTSITVDTSNLKQLISMLDSIPAIRSSEEKESIMQQIIYLIGEINDSTSTNYLYKRYLESGDTAEKQLQFLNVLVNQKTSYSYQIAGTLLNNNPPAINTNYQLNYLFQQLKDSLKLTATIAPALFTILSTEDYKDETIRLLGMLVDSGYLKTEAYNSLLPELFIQAKNELKRQNSDVAYNRYGNSSQSTLYYYLQILQPYYTSNEEIKTFMNKCLISRDLELRTKIACMLLYHKIEVNDSIWESIAKNDAYRYYLISALLNIGHIEKLPVSYRSQEQYARAIATHQVVTNKSKYKSEDLVYLDKRKVYFHQQWGYVYLFKYQRTIGYDVEPASDQKEWNFCLSGVQPLDSTKAAMNSTLATYTKETISESKTITEQFDALLFNLINSRRHTKYYKGYSDEDSYSGYNDYASPPEPVEEN